MKLRIAANRWWSATHDPLRTFRSAHNVDCLKAIAFAGHGIFIDVPGGGTIAAMHQQMLDAVSQIAAKVTPAQLIYESQ